MRQRVNNEVAAGLFHSKKMCKLTPKEVAAELIYFPTKTTCGHISPVINVKAFLPVIVVAILQIEKID